MVREDLGFCVVIAVVLFLALHVLFFAKRMSKRADSNVVLTCAAAVTATAGMAGKWYLMFFWGVLTVYLFVQERKRLAQEAKTSEKGRDI